jgi:hypothetical protein
LAPALNLGVTGRGSGEGKWIAVAFRSWESQWLWQSSTHYMCSPAFTFSVQAGQIPWVNRASECDAT